MEIVLVRHTKVAVSGVCYGFSDVELADTFEQEKEEVLKKVDSSNAVIFSSPSSRCTKLASSISETFETDDRIKELNFGDWEMRKWDDLSDPEFDVWMNDYINHRCPNGESLIDMKNRVEEFYKEISSSKHKKIIVVTHGGVIRLFHHLINEIPLDKIFDLKIEYGGVYTLRPLQGKQLK